MLTALGLRGFVMQIYTRGQVAFECGRERGERGERKGVFTPNSHVRSSEVSNWQTFESHFADERIKWQSAQKLLQNIRITEMFLLLYIQSMYIYATISFSHFSFICILQFRIFWRFAIYFFTHCHRCSPLLFQLECALNFILVHCTLTNYFDKYSNLCACVCVGELIADCTQNTN